MTDANNNTRAEVQKAIRECADLSDRLTGRSSPTQLQPGYENMPKGIIERLEPCRSEQYDMVWASAPQGIAYAKTADYHVVAAKWKQDHWCHSGGGIAWTEWLGIYFAKQGSDMLHCYYSPKILTRHPDHAGLDKRELWGYNTAKITVEKDNRIRVSWADRKGEGPSYEYELEALANTAHKLR